jgi:hypothetical protein
MAFDFPIEQSSPTLPPEVEKLIELSTARFAARFDLYRMFVGDKVDGWVAEYRAELRSVAEAAAKK